MTDLRALLGDDRYDDVMFRAMSAVASQPHGKPYTMRERVAAVLPDLLAEAWDAGASSALHGPTTVLQNGVTLTTTATPNPYRREQ